MSQLTEEQVKGLFIASGFEIKKMYRLVNKYWPDNEHYQELRVNNPWFLVKTQFGFIEVGPRKRVIHLDWSETVYEGELPATEGEEWITSGSTYVHSYSVDKLLINLMKLKTALTNYDSNKQINQC